MMPGNTEYAGNSPGFATIRTIWSTELLALLDSVVHACTFCGTLRAFKYCGDVK